MFLLVLSALTVTNSLSKKNKASFEYVPSSGAITADSDDFVVLGSGDTRISMKEIAAKVQQLSARPAGPSTDEVLVAVDAAVAGAIASLLNGKNSLTDGIANIESRLETVDGILAGLPQTRKAVSDLADNVKYLIAHSANVTSCATSGEVHIGDGTCIDPVPQCPRPAKPVNGSVELSADFIIPGVTATYSCPGHLAFVAGPKVRTCIEASLEFDGADPVCSVCEVTNCIRCVNHVDTCAECAYGHDLSADSKSCQERLGTIVVMGGSPGSGHNFRRSQSLAAKATSWSRFYPTPPITASGGAAALIRGTIYLVGHGGHPGSAGFYKLEKGATTWSEMPVIDGITQLDGVWRGRVNNAAFYCTVNGEGAVEDGFYLFALTGSRVFQPAVDDTKWKVIPTHGNGNDKNIRGVGATAVIGKLIYLLGGEAKNAATTAERTSALVDVFDTTSKTFSEGVPMTAGRIGHSAASYDGKIYIFGGRSAAGVILSRVEAFDPSTGSWSTKTPMPEAWEHMSCGPMPVFASGTVLIPFGYKTPSAGGIITSFEYDTKNDSWREGPQPTLKVGKYTVVQGPLK